MAKKQVETEEERQAREMIEGIASNIANLSRSVRSILDGRLKKKTIVVLLAYSANMHQWQIEKVLDAIAEMEKTHLK